ncbi:MAG: hypothetical protein R2695_13225 [Acidimicrobiales bacterium]
MPSWSYITGPQAYVTLASTYSGSYVPTVAPVYVDDTTPPDPECWGDGGYYGAAGQAITSAIPNTDPRLGAFATFRVREVAGFWPPGLDATMWTPIWATDVFQPLSVTITGF